MGATTASAHGATGVFVLIVPAALDAAAATWPLCAAPAAAAAAAKATETAAEAAAAEAAAAATCDWPVGNNSAPSRRPAAVLVIVVVDRGAVATEEGERALINSLQKYNSGYRV